MTDHKLDAQWLRVDRATSTVVEVDTSSAVRPSEAEQEAEGFDPQVWRREDDTKKSFWMIGPLWAGVGWKWTDHWQAPD